MAIEEATKRTMENVRCFSLFVCPFETADCDNLGDNLVKHDRRFQ